jgi:hypothetical protein
MEQPAFFKADKWLGIRIGYEFKVGERGLGYYLTKHAPKQAPKVVNPLIKSNTGKKRKMDQVWEQGAAENKKVLEKQGVGGREGRSIEER